MSVEVSRAVWRYSRSKGTARLVMLAIADNAHDDGIAWPGVPLLIEKANASDKAVRDGVKAAVDLGELEVRKARRGRSFINVYRVVVGRIGRVEVEYSRLPFELVEPFSHPVDSTGSTDEFTRRIPPGDSASQQADSTISPGGFDHGHPADSSGDASSSTSEPSEDPSEEPSAAAAAAQEELADRLALDSVRGLLDELDAGAELRQLALAAPERAIAWIQVARTEARRSPAGYVLAGLKSGDWPSARGPMGGVTAFDRCRAWIDKTGILIDPDEAHFQIDEWEDLGEIERQELHQELNDAIAARSVAAEAVA